MRRTRVKRTRVKRMQARRTRASRTLADYGADVVKLAPPARKGALQIRPPYHTYGAGRGMRRMRVRG